MDGYVQLDEISMDILKEIGNVGTGNAVTSLSQMMEQPIELDMPSLKVVKYYKMHELLEQPEELQTGILIEVTGQLKGIFLFMLSEAFTKTVINTILGEEERNLTSLDGYGVFFDQRAGEHHVRFLHTGPVPADGHGYGCVGAGAVH